jgi:hypothetical protein
MKSYLVPWKSTQVLSSYIDLFFSSIFKFIHLHNKKGEPLAMLVLLLPFEIEPYGTI